MLLKKGLIAILFPCLLFSIKSYAMIYYDESADDQYDDGSKYSYSSDDDSYTKYEDEDYAPRKKSKYKKTQEEYEESTLYESSYSARLPDHLSTYGEKVILVDPKVHAWGAYDSAGELVRAGLATAGSNWCADIGRSCRTRSGTFRIHSLGGSECISSKYPVGKGGAPMPYCMYFNGSQGLHGSDHVVEGNISHGCVRLSVEDAEWLRFNFSEIGTKVIVRPY